MKTPHPIHSPSPVRTLLHIQTRTPSPDPSPSPGLPTEAHVSEGGADAGTAVSQTGPGPSTLGAGPSTAVLDFISSTATVDRYHEIIDPAGWHLESYRRNPVFQNAHQYGDILFTLGKALITEVRTVGNRSDTPHSALRTAHSSGPLVPRPSSLLTDSHPRPSDRTGSSSSIPHSSSVLFQRIQFATDINPMARIAYGLYRGQFLNAVSVGFIPIRWQDADPDSRSAPESDSSLATRHSSLNSGPPPRRKYLEQELLEVSAVAIPANPDALALALKSGAVAKSDLADTLDLLRSLTVDYGPWRPANLSHSQLTTLNSQLNGGPWRPSSVPPRTQLTTLNSQLLLNLARELRRILRRA